MVTMKSCDTCIYANNIDTEWPCCKCAKYSQWTPEKELVTEPEPEYDPVKRPKHYNREGGMESIDEMVLVFGTEAVKNFCLCNVWKYRYRAADKNGEEDLKKSDWYMNKYKELCEIPTTVPKYVDCTRACLDKSN